jgi:hypothetical protein
MGDRQRGIFPDIASNLQTNLRATKEHPRASQEKPLTGIAKFSVTIEELGSLWIPLFNFKPRGKNAGTSFSGVDSCNLCP